MADFYFAGADESAAGRVFLVQLSRNRTVTDRSWY